jgi:transglutaminase-like putative cysteine protease/predicted glutamine amidotransferase
MADSTERRTSDPPKAAADVRREHQMTRLLAMSFDGAASPSITLRALTEQEERENPYGWGFAWYPDQTPCALVVKDPTSIGENAMTKLLREWERFESTTFLCHLRGAARTLQEQDTHPFARSYAGRDWLFAHNGDILGELGELLPLGDDPVFEPVGRSDSEHAFCWLLTRIREQRARRLADLGWPLLHAWFRELDRLGTSNFLLSDGTDLVVYHDEERYNGLSWTRLVPPHTAKLETSDIVVDLGDAGDRNRTVILVSTVPLDGASWRPMEGGQMVVIRRGAFLWDSHADAAEQKRIVAPIDGARRIPPPAPSSSRVRQPTPARSSRVAPIEPAPRSISDAALPLTLPNVDVWRRLGSSLLSIVHETLYRYSAPVDRSTHLYRLRPVHDRTQELLAHELAISAEDLRRDYEDVFGNATSRTEVEHPYDVMRITSRSIVRVSPTTGEDLQSPVRRFTLPLVWMPWQRQMMTPYLLPPELPETELNELYAYAMSFVERQDHDLVQTLLDINGTIYRDFRYVSGSTTLETTPFEVFVKRRGVCQDFAHLFICLARLLSIPARYRVGYIYTGAGYENKVQSEASHAWVELYLPWRGWVGFDPTNGCVAGLDHVRVACGRNYRDATPTSGTIYKGGGAETLSVDVRVEEL